MLTFRKEDRPRVAAGEITVSFRLWKRAKVKAGKRYETGFGAVEIDDVQVIPAGLVSDDDARLAGCASVEEAWHSAGEHTGTNITPKTLLHRVQFRFLG
jgi:hypothetical protein